MKSIISCTADEKYSYFIPIVTWTWNKLGVGVVLFLPESSKGDEKIQLCLNRMNYGDKENKHYYFNMPKHKEATGSQCVRLYGACLDLPEDEVLVTSDVDMAVLKIPPSSDGFTILGSDLVPIGQLPICYISAKVKDWRSAFNLRYGSWTGKDEDLMKTEIKTYQQCLDEILSNEECENMRGNFWSRDQEIAYNKIVPYQGTHYESRTNGQNQFATNRIDRDDAFFMDRLSPDIIDYHMHRPGFTDDNFEKIISVISYFYPNEDLTWMREYQQEYKKLL